MGAGGGLSYLLKFSAFKRCRSELRFFSLHHTSAISIVSCQTDCLGRAKKNGTRTQEVQAPGEEGRRGA